MRKSLTFFFLILFLTGCGGQDNQDAQDPKNNQDLNKVDPLSPKGVGMGPASGSEPLPSFLENPLVNQSYIPFPPQPKLLTRKEKESIFAHERANYYYDLGSYYLNYKEDPKGALEKFLKGVTFEPDFPQANLRISQILLLKKYFVASFHFLLKAELALPLNEEIQLTKKAVRLEHIRFRNRKEQILRALRSPLGEGQDIYQEKSMEKIQSEAKMLEELSQIEKMFLTPYKALKDWQVRLPAPLAEQFSSVKWEKIPYYFETPEEIQKKKEQAIMERQRKDYQDTLAAEEAGLEIDPEKLKEAQEALKIGEEVPGSPSPAPDK